MQLSKKENEGNFSVDLYLTFITTFIIFITLTSDFFKLNYQSLKSTILISYNEILMNSIHTVFISDILFKNSAHNLLYFTCRLVANRSVMFPFLGSSLLSSCFSLSTVSAIEKQIVL